MPNKPCSLPFDPTRAVISRNGGAAIDPVSTDGMAAVGAWLGAEVGISVLGVGSGLPFVQAADNTVKSISTTSRSTRLGFISFFCVTIVRRRLIGVNIAEIALQYVVFHGRPGLGCTAARGRGGGGGARANALHPLGAG